MALFVFAGFGAVLGLGSQVGQEQPPAAAPSAAPSQTPTESADAAEQVALYQQERATIDQLAANLAGNPARSLVADFQWLARQDTAMAAANLSVFSAESIVAQTTTFREELAQSVAVAETRRVNATGSITEGIVDASGNGFIDIQWDAATACGVEDRENWRTLGCVAGDDPLTVHLLPDSEIGSDWALRYLALHELAHVYQRADNARSEDHSGYYQDLLAQGYFQGSDESMADCYALAYDNSWSLNNGNRYYGYGYVCGDADRQAIRNWAATLNAPMT